MARVTRENHMLKSARTVSALTLVSRVLGLVRDALTAQLLGAGWVNDALSYAWTIPNAFRRLFGEGALGSAFVPVFTRTLENEGEKRAREVANGVISSVGLFLALLAGALVAAVTFISPATLAGWSDRIDMRQAGLVLWLLQVLLPYLAVICVIAQFMGVLNALGRFAVPAIAPLILNVVWIAAVVMAATRSDDPQVQVRWIAWGILLAAVLQFAWHLPFLARWGMGFRLVRPRLTPELREVGTLFVPMLLGMGAGQINVIVDRNVALAMLPEGGTTHIYYGLRVMQFPLGLVAVALGTAVYPTLLRLATRREDRAVATTASQALRTNLVMCLPAAFGLVVLAEPIVALLFGRGEYGAAAVTHTSSALVGYALGIPSAGLVILLNRVFYATGDTRTPMLVGLSLVLVNAGLDIALVGPLGEFGLGLATSITSILTAVLLLRGFRSRLDLAEGEHLLGGFGAVIGISLTMTAIVWAADTGVLRAVDEAARSTTWLRVGVGAGVGLVSYAVLASRFCPREWGEITSLVSRRRKAD